MTSRERIIEAFGHLPSLHRVTARLPDIELRLERQPRTIVPVAALARIMDVSIRVVWKWIELRLLKTQEAVFAANGRRINQRGIPKTAALRFLKHLTDNPGLGREIRSSAGRPPSARNRMLKLKPIAAGQGLSPTAYARLAGVSGASVHRAIQHGFLDSHRPTPGRIMIGKAPRKIGHGSKKNI